MGSARDIPSIEQLRQRAGVQALEEQFGRAAVVHALRAETDALRTRLLAGAAPPGPVTDRDRDRSGQVPGAELSCALEEAVAARLATENAPSLQTVINATGVILHTNLGRAPLASSAAARAASLATGYTNLEYDLERGIRGRRDLHAERLLCRLTGAGAAVVVNNNAAATLIALAALAAGREVLISRGELVEIGGSFRIPDVLAQSGARLREIGTTNRTRVSDYAAAVSDRTAMILRVHPSNFRIEGFTERPSLASLVALGRRFDIAVVEDLGSGYLGFADDVEALRNEPDVRSSVADGADLVMFSGDKLLGGPQAGILVGSPSVVDRVRRHPLMRALRTDKMTCAALEATLAEHLAGRASRTVPAAAMIVMPLETIARRAEALALALASRGLRCDVVDGLSTIGGGSAPGSALPTRLVSIVPDGLSATDLEAAMRSGSPPVIARIEADRVLLDLRTVSADMDGALTDLVARATGKGDGIG